MQFFLTLLKYVCLFIALMIPGVILGKRKRITDEARFSLSNILTDIAMPFLVFAKLLDTDIADIRVTYIIISLAAPFIVELSLFAITCVVFRKKPDDIKYHVNRFCSLFPNCGFIGLPLAAAIFPENPEVVFYISMFNITSTYLLLTLGVYVLSESRSAIEIKKLIMNPILIAVVFGVIGSIIGRERVSFFSEFASTLAQLATPLSMLILGYNFSKMSLRNIFTTADVYKVASMRLLVSPAIMLAALLIFDVLFGVTHSLAMSMLLATGVSTAGTASAIANRYGKDGSHGAVATIGNTLLSVITLPVMCTIGNILFK